MRSVPGPYARPAGWIDRLAHELHLSRRIPFDWGANDCILFSGRGVLAMTGVDAVGMLAGLYDSPAGAMRVLRAEGVRLPVDLADALWGPRQHISRAQLGDLVATQLGEPANMGPSIGICYGRSSLFVGTHEGASGLVSLDTHSLEHCYRPWASS